MGHKFELWRSSVYSVLAVTNTRILYHSDGKVLEGREAQLRDTMIGETTQVTGQPMVHSSNSRNVRAAATGIQRVAMAALMMVLAVGGLLLAAGRAEAQSTLPPCPSDVSVRWHNCFGTYTWADGDKYVGEYKDGKLNGQGTYTLADGRKYVGEYKDDKRTGNGKEFAANGSLTREGYWIANNYFGPTPPTGYKPPNAGSRIAMVKDGGTYTVPVTINGELKLQFTVDSGASDVTIPSDVVSTLIRMGAIKSSDFIGSQKYQLADGSIINSKTFTIRSLKVGDRTIQNVKGSVASANGSLLLGQSFLGKFKSWSMDNTKHELVLE